jgi:hypothetical protein
VAIVAVGAGVLGLLLAADGRASLHHPDDQTAAVPVGDDGAPESLPFDEFSRRRLILRNAGNPAWPLVALDPQTKQPVLDKDGKPALSDRGALDARIKREREKKGRTADERAALAVDLLRFRDPVQAEAELKGTRRGFLPNVTLAHVVAEQGRWAEAAEYLSIANEERPPASLPGTAPKKLAWQLKLNKGPLTTLFRLRGREARAKDEARAAKKEPPAELLPENELPDRIFDVNFVNAAGQYEPGVLADAEKAKLPPDALATVQQLVLWFPFDVRLYWLLAEVYAATGELKTAAKILDECAWSLEYSNRKVLMAHREAVAKAAAVVPPPDDDQPPVVPFTMRAVWWYFGAVGVFALLALVRAVLRRKA